MSYGPDLIDPYRAGDESIVVREEREKAEMSNRPVEISPPGSHPYAESAQRIRE
jgi:hypothetical protein